MENNITRLKHLQSKILIMRMINLLIEINNDRDYLVDSSIKATQYLSKYLDVKEYSMMMMMMLKMKKTQMNMITRRVINHLILYFDYS